MQSTGAVPKTVLPAGPARSARAARPGHAAPVEQDLPALARETRRRRTGGALVLAVLGALGGVVVGLAIQSVLPLEAEPADVLGAVSTLAATVGTYGVLVLIVLISRLPALEQAYGLDRLAAWHRRIAPWALALIAIHLVTVVWTQALPTGTGWWGELWALLGTSWWLALAGLAAVLFALVGVVSWRVARRRIPHGVWWGLHLTTYAAVLLAFGHQITAGGPFLAGWATWLWSGLYVAALGSLVIFRVLVPIGRNGVHRPYVAAVRPENDDVVSVVVGGRHLDRPAIQPGQFFIWRFDHPGLRLEGHPWSVSAMGSDRVRITVRTLGDASSRLISLPIGTRAFAEGPYGAITAGAVAPTPHGRLVLIAGGVGIGPVLGLADRFAGRTPVDIIYRASSLDAMVHLDELAVLERRGVRVHLMPGPRRVYPMHPAQLEATVGRLDDAELYICGPGSLVRTVTGSAGHLGARPDHIHYDSFRI